MSKRSWLYSLNLQPGMKSTAAPDLTLTTHPPKNHDHRDAKSQHPTTHTTRRECKRTSAEGLDLLMHPELIRPRHPRTAARPLAAPPTTSEASQSSQLNTPRQGAHCQDAGETCSIRWQGRGRARRPRSRYQPHVVTVEMGPITHSGTQSALPRCTGDMQYSLAGPRAEPGPPGRKPGGPGRGTSHTS